MRGIYALYDAAANDISGPLMVFPHETVAIRTFADILSDPKSFPRRHPKDFTLVQLANLTDAGNAIEPLRSIHGDTMRVVQTATHVLATLDAAATANNHKEDK